MLKDRLLIVMFFFATIFLYSCNDSELAKDVEGTWTTSYVMSYEDGTKTYIDEQISFKKNNPAKNGGSFIEIRTSQDELDEDEVSAKYRWISKIEGTWEINIEDLVLHYNISTLEVEIGKDDVDYKLNNQGFLWDDLGTMIRTKIYMDENLHKRLKKAAYKDMFNYYKEVNRYSDEKGISFPNVQIHGSVLSYETSDMGRIEYYRVKGANNLNKNKRKEETLVESDEEVQHELIQDEEYSEEETIDEPGYSHRLSGFIDKYEINMFLNIKDDGNVSGYYYYDSQGPGKKIYLSGQFLRSNDTSKLTLNCDNQDIFDGYIEENKYSGDFTNSSKQLMFNLRMLN